MERDENVMNLNTKKHKIFTTKNMILVAMFGAISMALMMVDFPIPIAPAFMKFDFADLPAMLATFMMGPIEGILVCIVKLALRLMIRGTETAFVGELANLIAAIAYAVYYFFVPDKLVDFEDDFDDVYGDEIFDEHEAEAEKEEKENAAN